MFWTRFFRDRENAALINAYAAGCTAVFTLLAFLAAAYYASIAGQQWGTAKEANEIAVNANRAWVGSVPRPPEEIGLKPRIEKFHYGNKEYIRSSFFWFFHNAGHRPARIESIHTVPNWGAVCPENPDYSFVPPGDVLAPGLSQDKTSKAFLIPGVTVKSAMVSSIPPDVWQKIDGDHTIQYCVYSAIEYRDADYPSILHHTTDCRMLIALPDRETTYSECTNNYANAD